MNKRYLFATVCATALLFASLSATAYNDHRGHNLDSLERAVARWTPDAVDRASEQELRELNRAYRDLMLGYSVLNGEKCAFYAHRALGISLPRGWEEANADAFRYLGQHFYGQEQYDSALVYYHLALDAVERIEGDQLAMDDERSALYGTLGNLYNVQGNIPEAMEWYAKAGEIFDQYGWNESNSTLYYNIGETWIEEGEVKKAREAYEKALAYGQEADDSLMVAAAKMGLGRVYIERNRPGRALFYLHAADEYFAAHEREQLTWRKETYEYISIAQQKQQHRLGLLCGMITGILGIGLGFWCKRRSDRKKTRASAGDGPLVPAPDLSPREREILDLLAKGYTTQQIADGLHLSYETIRWYRKKLLDKFDVANTAEMVALAKEQGLV